MEKDNNKDRISTSYIDVLDGVRAFSVFIVAFFHFWQQSWYNKVIYYSWFEKIGMKEINLEWLWRTGYVFVDMLILLSGFLLFLPHARHMVEGKKLDSTATFYRKRVARIVPSYYLSVLFLLFFSVIPKQQFSSIDHLKKDLFAQLTFTQMFDPMTKNTMFNGVLWTVAVEVSFYLIFPLVAYFFKKKPVITYICMTLASFVYIQQRVLKAKDLGFMINQMPTFLGVFANGMMGALIFVHIANKYKREKYLSAVFTLVAVLSLYMIRLMLKESLLRSPNTQVWQVEYRYLLSLVFLMFIISLSLSDKWLRFIFSNRFVRYLATISYNFYIWHQVIAVKFKYGMGKNNQIRIPNWEGDRPPNFSGDTAWQIKYTLIILLASLIVATLLTYFFEKPMANLIMGKRKPKREKEQMIEEYDVEKENLTDNAI